MADLITIDVDTGGAGDYSSLSAAESGEQKNLVTADECMEFVCRSSDESADTTDCLFDSWTTDSTRYIIIKTAASDWPGTQYDTTKYRFEAYMRTREDYTRYKGIQFYRSASYVMRIEDTAIAALYLDSCIFKGNSDSWLGYVFGLVDAWYVLNCIFYDVTGTESRALAVSSGDYAYIHNCTFHNCYRGINSASTLTICKNVLMQDISNEGFYGSYDTTNSTNNCSNISSDAPGSNGITSSSVVFADEGNDDFALSSSDTTVRGEGVDLSGDSDLPITTDILGTTRSAWDIGAHEYVNPLIVDQEGYRWRNDDGSESAATWQANQDTNVTISKETTTRLRVLINATGDADAETYQLEYKEVSDAATEWRKVDS